MIAFDVNVLVHADREDSPQHVTYRDWVSRLVTGPEPFGVANLAIESGSTWATADRDYSRFPGLALAHPPGPEDPE